MTSWVDAKVALSQLEKGKAVGNKWALWMRSKMQTILYDMGLFVHKNNGKILFVGLLTLITLCVGLKSTVLQTDIEKLWIEEGGRLEKELHYMRTTLGEGSGSTNQILIQTPKSLSNILSPHELLVHLEAVRVATQVTVDMFEVTWRLKDICYSTQLPNFDTHYIDSMLDNLMPCAIITPLDCFWEGSKLHGPEYPVSVPGLGLGVQWTDLNPQNLLEAMKLHTATSSQIADQTVTYFKAFQNFMQRAGITTAYQKRPCLDPLDPKCPLSSPNKISAQAPDIGAELTGGCYGFATKFMHWPEDLIVGGVTKNKTGHIIKAKAIQSIVQLMGEQDMYEYWQDTYKVHNMDWSVEKAKMVLEAWQRRFYLEIKRFSQHYKPARNHNIHLFTSTALSDIMTNFSHLNLIKVIVGFSMMAIYAGVILLRWREPIQSQVFLGIAGILLIVLSVTAGLGFCALIGLPFNASTIQITPFLALGLDADAIFLLIKTFNDIIATYGRIPVKDQIALCLKQSGTTIVLAKCSLLCAFIASAIIPIPAMRTFVLQTAVLCAINIVTCLTLFPSIACWDLRRRKSNRVDVFCCIQYKDPENDDQDADDHINQYDFKSNHKQSKEHHYNDLNRRCDQNRSLRPSSGKKKFPNLQQSHRTSQGHQLNEIVNLLNTKLYKDAKSSDDRFPHAQILSPALDDKNSKAEKDATLGDEMAQVESCETDPTPCRSKWTIDEFCDRYFVPFLQRDQMKGLIMFSFTVMMVAGIVGIFKVEDGLQMTEIVPRDTSEHKFLDLQTKYFSFYMMYAVTQGNFDYPSNQRLLYEYHHAFTRINNIIKNDDGGLTDFWLTSFRDWLKELQVSFERDLNAGCISQDRWHKNASDQGILAYKLLVQTGRVDNPIDKSLVLTGRLVDENGIINPKAFYNYLTAWVTNDALAYTSSQANFRPEPKNWVHDPRDVELKIPKSQPLVYAQIPFYLKDMKSTQLITEAIQEIRSICHKFEERGLPNFPTGIPFIYWEQYLRLKFYLFSALIITLAGIFLVISLFLLNPWAAFLIVFMICKTVVELFGFMGLMCVRMSAAPAVILILAAGICANFYIHLTFSFLSSLGNRNRRMKIALSHMASPIAHGLVSTSIGVLMMAFSRFDFIFRYFFCVLFALVLLIGLNGLIFLPVLLSILGPPPEIIPLDHEDRLSLPTPTPSPSPTPPPCRKKHRKVSGPYFERCRYNPRVQSELSLSTISEETHSHHSSAHEIVVQPELILETTTLTNTSPITSYYAPQATSSPNNLSEENVNTKETNIDSASDRESPLSRESPMSDSSGVSFASGLSSGRSSVPMNHPQQQTVTTKVKATAKLKVELHRCPEYSSCKYSCSRSRRESQSSSSSSSSSRCHPTVSLNMAATHKSP